MTQVQTTTAARGLVIAAPSSGSGKTTLTLGLLRALRRRGVDVAGAKCGPDYIDPRFHEAACGAECPNLDGWAMTPARLRQIYPANELVIVEGVMGLFDGSADGRSSTAELAKTLQLPVVLVVDCARMAQSLAALVAGFCTHDPDVHLAGVILNNVGSDRHERLLRDAMQPSHLPILGAVRRAPGLAHPARHLGLVQAREHPELDAFVERVADHVTTHCDLDALRDLARRAAPAPQACARAAPPAQRIAIAQDAAFAFAYPHLLADWRAAGAEMSFFSPLDDQVPGPADMIFLPGGYPELHAGRLAAAHGFKSAIRDAAAQGTEIYGECGGYMCLGQTLTDAQGHNHDMLGLLDLHTTFAERKLHLGYRKVSADAGPFAGAWAAHEFHYATTSRARGTRLFTAHDAWGQELAPMGLVNGSVSGSFAHLIDPL